MENSLDFPHHLGQWFSNLNVLVTPLGILVQMEILIWWWWSSSGILSVY